MSLARLLFQPSAQTKVCYFRSGCSVLFFLFCILKIPNEGDCLVLWAACSTVQLSCLNIQSKYFFILFMSIVFCSSSIWCYKESGFILLITSPQVFEACCQVCPKSSPGLPSPATSEPAYGICAFLCLLFFCWFLIFSKKIKG